MAFYERVRGQVEFEDQLYNQRIIWLITMQAFLFATVGLLLQAKVGNEDSSVVIEIDLFIGLSAIVGVAVAIICARLLHNAREALNSLKQLWDTQLGRVDLSTMSAIAYLPHPRGGTDGQAYHIPLVRSGYLPYTFALVWLLVLGYLVASNWDRIVVS